MYKSMIPKTFAGGTQRNAPVDCYSRPYRPNWNGTV